MAKPENIRKVADALFVAQMPKYMVPIASDPLSIGYRQTDEMPHWKASQENRTLVERPKEGARDGPTIPGLIGTGLAVSGWPTVGKGTTTSGATPRTSILSSAMDRTRLNRPGLVSSTPTPVMGKVRASGNPARIFARRVPYFSIPFLLVDTMTSDNIPRTIVGNLGGLAGGYIGALGGGAAGGLVGAGAGALPGAFAGGAAGVYYGNKYALDGYDYYADRLDNYLSKE